VRAGLLWSPGVGAAFPSEKGGSLGSGTGSLPKPLRNGPNPTESAAVESASNPMPEPNPESGAVLAMQKVVGSNPISRFQSQAVVGGNFLHLCVSVDGEIQGSAFTSR